MIKKKFTLFEPIQKCTQYFYYTREPKPMDVFVIYYLFLLKYIFKSSPPLFSNYSIPYQSGERDMSFQNSPLKKINQKARRELYGNLFAALTVQKI